MTDSKEQIINKIKKAKTDTNLLPNSDKDINKRPEAENLLGIYSSMNHQSLAKTINEFSGKNFSDLKQKLAEIVAEKILPISNEINKLQKDPKFIDDVLHEGAEKADKIVRKKVEEMKKIIGF
jgi:tryptophanyl-tRNA synthetase